jgi:hypothetical protein
LLFVLLGGRLPLPRSRRRRRSTLGLSPERSPHNAKWSTGLSRSRADVVQPLHVLGQSHIGDPATRAGGIASDLPDEGLGPADPICHNPSVLNTPRGRRRQLRRFGRRINDGVLSGLSGSAGTSSYSPDPAQPRDLGAKPPGLFVWRVLLQAPTARG